jgi:hypothetical protein
MAISMKVIGRSVVESMVFLATLSMASSFIFIFFDKNGDTGLPIYAGLPVAVALASAASALLFPKPTFWKAFAKIFGGGLLTFAIFAAIALTFGPPVVMLMFNFIWEFGVGIFDWSTFDHIIAGIFGMIIYFFFVFLVISIILMFLFALVNIFVNLVINAVASRNQEDEVQLQENPAPSIESAEHDPFQESNT